MALAGGEKDTLPSGMVTLAGHDLKGAVTLGPTVPDLLGAVHVLSCREDSCAGNRMARVRRPRLARGASGQPILAAPLHLRASPPLPGDWTGRHDRSFASSYLRLVTVRLTH